MKSKNTPLQPKAAMTVTQRRKAVEVARDVLLQLRLKRIHAHQGIYMDVEVRDEFGKTYPVDVASRFGKDGSFQKTFRQNPRIECTVCAIGAVYISFINKFNKVKNDAVSGVNSKQMLNTLETVFSGDQLRLMEAVFEGHWIEEPEWYGDLMNEYYESNEDTYPAFQRVNELVEAFYNRYYDETNRLRAIMQNVIRNNGEFRLPLRVR